MIGIYLGFILSWSFKTISQLYHNYTVPYSITNIPSIRPTPYYELKLLPPKNKKLFKN
jgi:hypothetical protein